MITAECPCCQTQYRVKPEAAGRKAKCRACHQEFTIAGTPATTPYALAAPVVVTTSTAAVTHVARKHKQLSMLALAGIAVSVFFVCGAVMFFVMLRDKDVTTRATTKSTFSKLVGAVDTQLTGLQLHRMYLEGSGGGKDDWDRVRASCDLAQTAAITLPLNTIPDSIEKAKLVALQQLCQEAYTGLDCYTTQCDKLYAKLCKEKFNLVTALNSALKMSENAFPPMPVPEWVQGD